MKTLPPLSVPTGATWRPSWARRIWQWMRKDRDELNARRFYHSEFILPFGAMATGDNAEEGVMYVRPPAAFGAWEIVGVELRVRNGTGSGTYTLDVTDGSSSLAQVSASISAADTWTSASSIGTLKVPSNTEVSFTLAGFAATALTDCAVTVYVRFDRLGGTLSETFDPPADSATKNPTTFNNAVSAYQTDIDANANATTALRIQVLSLRDLNGTNFSRTFGIPATGSTINSMGLYLLQTISDDTDFTLRNEAGTSLGTANLTGAGNASTVKNTVTLGDTQTDDPDDVADAWSLDIDVNGTSTDAFRAYAVLYWET